MESSFDQHKGFWITFANRGIGPAEVKRVRVTVDGKPADEWVSAVAMLLHKSSFQMPGSETIEDAVLSPGYEINALRIREPDDARAVLTEGGRLMVDVCYCSTLGECWVLHQGPFGTPTTTPVPECRPDPKPFESISESTLRKMNENMVRATQADAGARDATRDEDDTP
jgi:hypothetical protein